MASKFPTYYLVFDLEMTGPDPEWNEIVQIGAVLCNGKWKELGRFLSNVYPENPQAFSSASEKIHDLSLAELENAPIIFDVLESFETWILKTLNVPAINKEQVFRDVIMCGQSVMYDINFLRAAYKKQNMPWLYNHTQLDLHTLSWFLFKILDSNDYETPRSRSLGAIAAFFELEREGDTHNALEDAVLTADCLAGVMSYVPYLKYEEE
ncbi:MAG: 3'-5' exonuclease [Bacteroidales bacterium]|nr:3'-5' exonuclease [Bacteroidales bacterium]